MVGGELVDADVVEELLEDDEAEVVGGAIAVVELVTGMRIEDVGAIVDVDDETPPPSQLLRPHVWPIWQAFAHSSPTRHFTLGKSQQTAPSA